MTAPDEGLTMPEQTTRVADATTPLWLGTGILRVVTYPFAVIAVGLNYHEYARPWLAVVVLVFMGCWTGFTVAYCLRPALRSRWAVLTDLLVTAGLVLTTLVIFRHDGPHVPSVITTVWGSVPAVAVGVYGGWLAGMSAGLLLTVATGVARWTIDMNLGTDGVLLMGSGLVIGMASTAARRSMALLREALRAEAATAERERLAASIHDSVLQVLAYVRRRGGELGGEAAELGRLAGEQEIALRALVTSGPSEPADEKVSDGAGEVDLHAQLQPLASPSCVISTPAEPTMLARDTAAELVAAVREALANVTRHAGAEAKAWVLVEDLGEQVVVSVRDDGPGIPPGRLAEAHAEGRLGVAHSIRSKIRALGGTATLDTAPGQGTEWELRVPRATPATRPRRKHG